MDEFEFKPVSLEVTFAEINPDLMALMTGGSTAPPKFSVEVRTPIKRTWWQWLLRRPRQWHYVYIPNARLAGGDD